MATKATIPSEAQDGTNHERASRMAKLAVAKIQSQADEIEALRAENARLRTAFDAGVIDYAVLKAENDRLREALKPFVDFIDAFDAKPLRSLDDKFYGIHSGTRWQAELRFSDFRRARAALNGEGA
jgi:hypothetical protein